VSPEKQTVEGWKRLQLGSLIVGVIALALCLVGALFSTTQFYQSYLLAYLFWIGIALGCLGIAMLHSLSGGGWGIAIRRVLESGMRTLPLMLLLFLPLLFGMQNLYEWARPGAAAEDLLLRNKSAYLNVPAFLVRSTLYFALWISGALLLTKWSRDLDRTGDPRLISRLRILSGPGLVLYGLTITFASIDWVMSLEPHWYSTIYGVHFMGGHVLSAFAFAILFTALLTRQEPLSSTLQPSHFHDLGNLLLAFVMLWAYFSFSQWLIMWSGNLPEEVTWYVRRTRGGWEWIALCLVLFHFTVPFFLLLSRGIKRRLPALCVIAGAIVFMRLLDIFWYTVPAFHPGNFHVHWMDILAPVGIGGIWIAAFIWQLRPVPLVPLQDPYVKEALERGRA
jgi:hypothetical protein